MFLAGKQAFSFFLLVAVSTVVVAVVATVTVSMVVTSCIGVSISSTLSSTYCCGELFKESSLLQHLQRLQQSMIEITATTITVKVIPALYRYEHMNRKKKDIHICIES